MDEDIYIFLAEDGNKYEGDIGEIRQWYSENRIGPDDIVTDKATKEGISIRELLRVQDPEPQTNTPYPKPPVKQSITFPNPPPSLDNHLWKAILSTVCVGCLPMGILAIVYATQVDVYVRQGDYEAASQASEKANTWATWSIIIGMVEIVILILAKTNR